MDYLYSTDQFGIDHDKLHFLRNRFKYKSINLKEIELIEITKGKYIRNWLIIFLFGLFCVGFSIYYTKSLFDFFYSDQGGHIYIEEVVVPILPFILGIFAVIQSLKTTEIMIVKYEGKKTIFSIGELKKKQKLDDFINYLQQNLGNKKINIDAQIIF